MTTPIIVDAHLDIAWNYRALKRDFLEALSERRAREAKNGVASANGTSTVSLDAALAGNVRLVVATLYVSPAFAGFGTGETYNTPEEAHAQALAQVEYYDTLFTHPSIRAVRTRADLQAVRASWATETPLLGMVLSMEGADPIRTPQEFPFWYEKGIRAVGLAWSGTRYSGGTIYNGRGAGPLTDLGRELLPIMQAHNAILDVSHMDEPAFDEALDLYGGQIIASHSNPRAFRDTQRHLSDDRLKRLSDKNGVVGVVPYNTFLHHNPDTARTRSNTPLSRYLDAIDHSVQMTGTARHVGIGSDFDGGFGMERTPVGLDSLADLPKIAEGLSARGYSDADVTAICGGNWLRVLEAALPL
jgi:membrane dipeptidase